MVSPHIWMLKLCAESFCRGKEKPDGCSTVAPKHGIAWNPCHGMEHWPGWDLEHFTMPITSGMVANVSNEMLGCKCDELCWSWLLDTCKPQSVFIISIIIIVFKLLYHPHFPWKLGWRYFSSKARTTIAVHCSPVYMGKSQRLRDGQEDERTRAGKRRGRRSGSSGRRSK